jgi:hypothetical protein
VSEGILVGYEILVCPPRLLALDHNKVKMMGRDILQCPEVLDPLVPFLGIEPR